VEYLVTMTTHVPDGTTDEAVDDIRAREAGRSKELAAEGHLLRLWRPPLQPGEWRTLGLFAAGGSGPLEDVLTSMPLRVWRHDDVTPLSMHPHDPGPSAARPRAGTEFLTTFTLTVPDGTPADAVAAADASEGDRARELAAQGHLQRLWRRPDGRSLGLWRADDGAQMSAILASLPLEAWLDVLTTPLTTHPSDPGVR
jgi:muconolactone delta-isomerase